MTAGTESPSLVSIKTAKKGIAKLEVRLHKKRNRTNWEKLRSRNGSARIASAPWRDWTGRSHQGFLGPRNGPKTHRPQHQGPSEQQERIGQYRVIGRRYTLPSLDEKTAPKSNNRHRGGHCRQPPPVVTPQHLAGNEVAPPTRRGGYPYGTKEAANGQRCNHQSHGGRARHIQQEGHGANGNPHEVRPGQCS